MQEEQVVCYESRKLNVHEKNYLTCDLELAEIIHALKMWRNYLLGRRFVLMSDHSGLRYLFDQPNLNARQARWLATISEFEFEIRSMKGKENKVADSLSRQIQVNHIATMGSYAIDLRDQILQAGQQDRRFRDMIYVPDNIELKKLILREFHAKPYLGHPRYQKTLTAVKKFYYWLNMKKDVVEFVARWLDCQQVKA
eukprot:PITA_13707